MSYPLRFVPTIVSGTLATTAGLLVADWIFDGFTADNFWLILLAAFVVSVLEIVSRASVYAATTLSQFCLLFIVNGIVLVLGLAIVVALIPGLEFDGFWSVIGTLAVAMAIDFPIELLWYRVMKRLGLWAEVDRRWPQKRRLHPELLEAAAVVRREAEEQDERERDR